MSAMNLKIFCCLQMYIKAFQGVQVFIPLTGCFLQIETIVPMMFKTPLF